jgi:hypothetical protein
LKSPPKIEIDKPISLRPGARLEKLWKELRFFRQSRRRLACYDGTMLPEEINPQCTPAQLRVKLKSTRNVDEIDIFTGIEMQTAKAG